jgi:hypothetical protein
MKHSQARTFSRRALLMTLLPGVAPAAGNQPLSGVRFYTATATVTFLGITLVTRKSAASGFARVGQAGGATILEFGAGSHPERCAGVNRLGYIRETVGGVESGGTRRRTFGFMTSSKEESFQQARKALGDARAEQSYTVLDSVGDSAGCESRVGAVPCSSSLRWPDWQAVESELMKQWPAAPKRLARLEGERSGFLAVVRGAMLQGGRGKAAYVHNDKSYTLDWSIRHDAAGRHELEGRISGGGKARFRLWFDESQPGAPPVAFEYQPRSFLRLLFEEAPESASPRLAQSIRPLSASLFVSRE